MIIHRISDIFTQIINILFLINSPNTEDLLMENKVDIAIWAHEHNYERFWPMYNYTVMNGTTNKNQPYNNARATLHIITGSAVSTNSMKSMKISINHS